MMRRHIVTAMMMALLATTLTAQTGSGLSTTRQESGFVPEGYQLDWSDEFEGTELNTQDWKFEIQDPGWVNNELQRYVGKTYKGQKVVFVGDDHLTIRCQKIDGQVVSGRINARPSTGWRYGYFEARIKLPKGKGTWPAFWMMPTNVDWSTNPWPRCGEIDIMEEVGYHAGYVSSSIHCDAYNHTKGTQKTHEMYMPTAEDEYHIYGLEWTADRLTFYVDGQLQLQFNKESDDHAVWPFHYAFHPILNLAWGGSWGGAQGVDESALPAEMLVDYVRVYKKPMPATAKKVVAYVTSWSSIPVDPMVMTHINYAFGGVGDDSRVYVDGTNRFRQVVELKKQNPALKVLLSIGGWGRGKFTPMAASSEKRQLFAQSCLEFCQQWGIDGIDIDWEFPGSNSSGEASPTDEKQNYTLLMRDLRQALGDTLLLTMASQAGAGYYDFKACMPYLDFVNVMTYDMASPPNHHSALYRGGQVGKGWMVATEAIEAHLKAGVPTDKLVMGLAFYGNGNADGSGSAGQISLQEIEDGIKSGKWTDHWDDVAKVPYVTNQQGQFVYGYDNQRSLTIKCQYIVDQDLAGGMYWEYANDNNMGTERNTVYDCLIGNATQKDNLYLGDTRMEYTGRNTYTATLALQQGQTYAVTGDKTMTSDSWYYDPDFFEPTVDGAYRFRALSGDYEVKADFGNQCFRVTPLGNDGQPRRYNTSDGTGCIWLIGAANSVGKPAYDPEGGDGWDESQALPLAAIALHRHQITLETGRQISAGQVNFKFFHQPAFGNGAADEFRAADGPCLLSLTDDYYAIGNGTDGHDNGNIYRKRAIRLKQTLVFTIDTTNPTDAVLTINNLTTGISHLQRTANDDTRRYDLSGRPMSRRLPARGLYIQSHKKRVAISN